MFLISLNPIDIVGIVEYSKAIQKEGMYYEKKANVLLLEKT